MLIRLNAMGDILLTVPLLKELSKQHFVHMVINSRWQPLAPFLPAQVHIYKGINNLLKLTRQLQKFNPCKVYDLQGKIASIAITKLLRAEQKNFYKKRTISEQLFALQKKYPIQLSDPRPIWQKYAEVAGIQLKNPDPLLELSQDYIDAATTFIKQFGLAPQKFVAIHRTASKPGKVLPDELVLRIAQQTDMPLVLFGNDSEKSIDGIKDLRNKIELKMLPGFLSQAFAVISSDSGPMHLTRAVNVPIVGIYLQTAPELGFSIIPGKKVLIISQKLDCKPCSLHGQNKVCPEGHFACRKPDINKICSQIKDFFRNLQ